MLMLVACAGCATLRRQPSPPDLPRDGEPARIFAAGVVSTNDVFASTFTPDGRTVVFTKFSPPKPMTLLTSRLESGRWTAPVPLPFSGTWRDLDPAFSPDGHRLYFSSARPSGPSPADTMSGTDTWYADREGDGWSAPRRLSEPVNGAATDMYPSATARGTLYFDSNRSAGRRMAFRAERNADGTLAAPELLPAAINADSGASNLFVDPDEQYVVFGARRAGGAGEMDLWISWRERGAWTTPRNLGPLVNTTAVEFCPFVSRDGRYLYFTRVTTIDPQRAERNIYVVRFDALRERLRSGPR
jgi:hypothetical protein